MNKVFIAPDAFVAFIDRTHQNHLHATAFFRYFAQEHYYLYTTLIAITASYMHMYQHMSPALANDFLRALSLSSITIIYAEEADWKLALKVLVSQHATEIHFPESYMSAVAYRRSINTICTFEYVHPLFNLSAFYLPV